MKKYLIIAITGLLLSVTSEAYTLEITPGGLQQALASEAATIVDLTLTGKGDARDLQYISTLPALRTLDMSGLQIVETKSDKAIHLSRHHFPANTLPAYIFSLSKLEKVVMPSTLTKIEEGAFASSNLNTVTFGASVKTIGSWAFYKTKLSSVVLPASTDSMGTGVFADCANLSNAGLSATQVTELLAKTFRGCTALKTITFPAKMTTLGAECLLGSGLELVSLNPSVNRIGAYALSSMPSLKSFSASDPMMEEGALYGNSALTSVSGQKRIGDLALAGNTALMLDSATTSQFTTLGAYALANNPTVRLFFNQNLKEVGEHVADGMDNLVSIKAIELEGNIPNTADHAFDGINGISGKRLWVHEDHLQSWTNHPEWSRFELKGSTLGTDPIISDEIAGADIKCFWQNDLLTVSASENLTGVSVYSTNGAILAISTPQTTEATIDLNGVADNIIVIRASTASGAKTFKLRRTN